MNDLLLEKTVLFSAILTNYRLILFKKNINFLILGKLYLINDNAIIERTTIFFQIS